MAYRGFARTRFFRSFLGKWGHSRTGFVGCTGSALPVFGCCWTRILSPDYIYAKRRHRLSHSTIEKLMVLHEQAPEFNNEKMGNILEHAVALFLSTSVTGSRENGGVPADGGGVGRLRSPYLLSELSFWGPFSRAARIFFSPKLVLSEVGQRPVNIRGCVYRVPVSATCQYRPLRSTKNERNWTWGSQNFRGKTAYLAISVFETYHVGKKNYDFHHQTWARVEKCTFFPCKKTRKKTRIPSPKSAIFVTV